MKFTLTNDSLTNLTSRSKLLQHLNLVLTKAYFKLSSGEFSLLLRGTNGAYKLILPTEYTGDSCYFSTDYYKWNIALQKFDLAKEITLNITKNFLTLSSGNSTNTINLGIVVYEDTSSEAIVINDFLNSKKAELLACDKKLILTPSLVKNFQLADSLFVSQARINSIGISAKNIMYSDRSVVLKINHGEILDAGLFRGLSADEEYIYLHAFLLKIFGYLAKTASLVYFSDDYSTIYWEDADSALFFVSEDREVALPTDEQFEAIQPENKDGSFNVSLKDLRAGLDLFIGFYEGSVWKPITFEITANKSVNLHYKHPTAEISKTLDGCSAPIDGKFVVDSENLTKILSKLQDIYPDDANITITFDDDAPGIYCNVLDVHEFILSKLDDEE